MTMENYFNDVRKHVGNTRASNNVNEGLTLEQYRKYKEFTVYDEICVPDNHTRIWISFDIDNDPDKSKRKQLYDWFNKQTDIESWGNSVATFLVEKCFTDRNNTDAIEYLKNELKSAGVLIDHITEWSQTEDISIYVIYRSTREGKKYSGHFVLIQNAKIKQAGVFKC